ncbi:MAG: pyridoxamine 5'-phosphate oxidase family protein [Labilithrix sp.]|nr:pyridoxamine 5'-phosphate oxidase family protein [Labilithrix sp.]MBX3221958.1 pyridoxamine 5'-phosphate oxidase family protein [Labilithrix sp.]
MKQHLRELLESFDTAMLITRHDDREHARPMAVAAVEGADTVWFATSQAAPKSEEIRKDARVSATFQSGRRFVALSGRAELVSDRAKIQELWKPTWRVWFPEGKEDPTLVLIRVTVTDAEFWDYTGARGLRYAFEAARALLTKHEPAMGEGQHGRVKSVAGAEPVSQRF